MAHIILLEDERILREDLSDFLANCGHSVQAVGSIAEFERQFAPGRHLIAILDLGLPDGDGMTSLPACAATTCAWASSC